MGKDKSMGILEVVKSEIERRIESCDATSETPNQLLWAELSALLPFLDTLEEEASYDTQKYTPSPSVDIEDVARVQFASHAKVFDKKRKAVFDWEQFREVVDIFYGFGKKDTLEEPANEDLEEAAMNYIAPIENEDGLKVINFSGQDIKDAFIAGAEWQEKRWENNRLMAQDNATEEECQREMDFVDNHIKKHHRIPTFSDAINYGIKWQKEQMMKIITKDDNLEEAGTQYVETYFRDIDWTPDVIKSCLEEAFISGGEYVFKQIKYE